VLRQGEHVGPARWGDEGGEACLDWGGGGALCPAEARKRKKLKSPGLNVKAGGRRGLGGY